ncbi:MAG: hypothetical protein DHS20C18_00180 [Saprospiraceae bacterium]|nr:MAG: hypothetical protein DHS20C18_00180 [Saprospiraceae bacterium]
MDSLTQITLGAAVGEVVLGRKAGNRAMVWGAIAGTIPDLDVLANFSADSISALAFHRAITHSATFAIATPFVMGWLIHRIYKCKTEQGLRKQIPIDMAKVWLFLVVLIGLGSIVMPIPIKEIVLIALTVSTGILVFPLIVFFRELLRKKPSRNENPDWKSWSWLFFWAIFTHPLLDCCTTYGTQFFQPFFDYRVAFNNISVVDPIYTIPFLICVIIASIFSRKAPWRRYINYLGIGLSSLYMLFTFINKVRVDRIFEQSLQAQSIPYHRFMTTPTIFNNVLWQGVAEGDTAFYQASYSIFDEPPNIPVFTVIPKGHELLEPYATERSIIILKWFSKGYFNVEQQPNGNLEMNDMRFGGFEAAPGSKPDFVFKFYLHEVDGELQAYQSREAPENVNETFALLWQRMMGRHLSE